MNRAAAGMTSQAGAPLHGRARTWLAGTALFLLVAIVYWPALSNGFMGEEGLHGFMGEDGIYVIENPALRSWQGLADIWLTFDGTDRYYPLTFTTLWAEYQLWGLHPLGYHAFNLILHATAAFLIWRILVRLALPGAWLTAAVFVVHPVCVESVAAVLAIRNPLSLVLALGSVLAYLRFSPADGPDSPQPQGSPRKNDWLYYFLALGLYIAALLAKTVTVTVPPVLLVICWWKRGKLTARDLALTAPFFAIGLGLCGVTLWVENAYFGASGPECEFSRLERVLIAGRAFWFYVGKLLWPSNLVWFYPRWEVNAAAWWQYLFPIAALALAVGLWLGRNRIGRGPLAAVLIFAGVLVPVLGFFYMAMVRILFVADHFQYHACISLMALACAAAVTVFRRVPARLRWLGPVAAAALLFPLAVVAQPRIRVFDTETTAMEDLVAKQPETWHGHYFYGDFLLLQGKHEESIAQFREAMRIEQSLLEATPAGVEAAKLEHDLAGYHVGIGLLQRKLGRESEADRWLRRGIEMQEELARRHPTVDSYQEDLATSYLQLADAEDGAGKPDVAQGLRARSLEIREKLARDNPADPKFQGNLAESYGAIGAAERAAGRSDQAVAAWRRVIEIRERLVRDEPTAAEYLAGLAQAYERLAAAQQDSGKLADALASRRKAVAIWAPLSKDIESLTFVKRVHANERRQRLAQNENLVAEYRNNLAASYGSLSLLERQMGLQAEAMESILKAIEVREGLARENPAKPRYRNDAAGSRIDLGILQCELGQFSEARGSFEKAIALREKLIEDYPARSDFQEGLAWGYADLGVAQLGEGLRGEAEVSCRKAIALREKLVRDNPDVNSYLDQLATGYRYLGDLLCTPQRADEAVASYRAAIEIRQKLVQMNPNDAASRASLAADLALCGDALAVQGNWAESAEMDARSLEAVNNNWLVIARLAMTQLAAGNEAAYRSNCEKLIRWQPENPATDAVLTVALALVAGDRSLADMAPAVALASRAATAAPAHPLAAILLGAADCRAGQTAEGVPLLTKELARLNASPGAELKQSPPLLVGQLVAETLLVQAYRAQGAVAELQRERESLRKLIDETRTPELPAHNGLPPWSVRFALEIAKRELAKVDEPPGKPAQ